MEESIQKSLKIVNSAIQNCEKIQPKFPEGTSQCSLLRNRINALKIARSLLLGEGREYSPEALKQALPPILSIHSKTSNARKKYEPGSTQYRRFTPTIEAMEVCRALLEQALARCDT